MPHPQPMLREVSDNDLLARLSESPDDAVAELHRRYADAVRVRAMRVLGDRTLAEVVVQDVFLRLWLRPDSFDPARGSLLTYLGIQARSRAIEQRRSSEARRERERRTSPTSSRHESRSSVEQEAVDNVVAARVREGVARLPPAERMVIEVAFFGEHSYRDAAALLGRPEGTVKTRIRSGLGHLRSSLNTEVPLDLRGR